MRTPTPTIIAVACAALFISACGKDAAPPQSQTAAPPAAQSPVENKKVVEIATSEEAKVAFGKVYSSTPSDAAFDKTFVPGLWRMSSAAESMTIYFDPVADLWGDKGQHYWQRGEAKLGSEENASLRKERAKHIPSDKLFTFSHGKGSPKPVMILTTAVNCGNCAALEKELAKLDVTYKVALTVNGPDKEEADRLESAACSKDPQKAWEALRERSEVKAVACSWAKAEHKMVGDLVTGELMGATPSAYFPDGSSVLGTGNILAKVKESLAGGAGF